MFSVYSSSEAAPAADDDLDGWVFLAGQILSGRADSVPSSMSSKRCLVSEEERRLQVHRAAQQKL